MLLCDPIGNMFEVMIDKRNGQVFFGQGWNGVGKFYGLYLGGWARIVFVRTDLFVNKLRDRLDREVIYPIPTMICWLGETPKNISHVGNYVVLNNFANVCQKPGFFHILEKTLTYGDVYSGRLVGCLPSVLMGNRL